MKKAKKIAVAALIRGYSDLSRYNMLINRNKHIRDNFIPKLGDHTCNVILFHEGDINDEQQKYIINQSDNMAIQFIDVGDFRRQFLDGYWFMCRFWSLEILSYLSDYDFVARIDDDCDIIHINEDELNHIVDNDVNYSTATMISMGMEFPHTKEWHKNFLTKYCEANNIPMNIAYDNVVTTYPNFMITNIPYYRNNTAVQKFLKTITDNNTIENLRIGDSVVWGMILDVIDNQGYYIIKDMQYNHHSHEKMVYGGMHLKYGGMVPDWPRGDFSYYHPHYHNL